MMKFFNLNCFKKYKQRVFVPLFSLLFLGYLFFIYSGFKTALTDSSFIFGYIDFQSHQQLLNNFVKFKMPFQDYFFEPSNGWFYLLIQSIPYLIFRRTFLAVLVIRHLYLPILGIGLSYIVAKNVLRKKHLIFMFLFFCLLFRTNYEFPSPRHLIAELSLSFFILYFLKNRTKYLLVSGIIAGLAILTSFEYGVVLNITVLFAFFASFFSGIKLKKVFFNKFFLGEIAILIPFFFWLYLKGVLRNYWEYTCGFINNFYYASPCSGDSFPRLSEIQTLRSASNLLIFNLPVEFLQRLNFYIVFSFYVVTALVLFVFFIKNKKISKINLVKLSLVVYGLLIFTRTLDTPCLGYFVYGLVPFFLLLALTIEEIILWIWRKKSFIFKVIGILGVTIMFSWFILTENTGYVVKIFGEQKKQPKTEFYEKEFYPPVGWFIRKDFAKGYKEIANFIVENTNKDDFLYVYPWGPYNQLTGRWPPNSIPTALHFLAGQQFMLKTKEELETKKPKFVVINIYNNLGTAHYGKTRGDVGRYFSLGYEDGPVFNGEGSIVEEYILENYETVLKNDLAIVMKKRTKPITIDTRKREIYIWRPEISGKIEFKSMEKKNGDGNYRIIGEKASWSLVFEDPIEALDVAVGFKLDGDFLTKHLSRYFLNLYPLDEGGKKLGKARILARKVWQTDKINLNQLRKIKTLKIEIGENAGLIWWLNPHNLEIREIIFYE